MTIRSDKIRILAYYLNGEFFNPSHDERILRRLIERGGIEEESYESGTVLKTTLRGRVYLKRHGYPTDAPEIHYGYIDDGL